jgi:hypothetical protein
MIAIAPTHQSWFDQLRSRPHGKVVNFWTPTPWNVRQLKPGDLFYFLLKAPIRKIAGFGQFVRVDQAFVPSTLTTSASYCACAAAVLMLTRARAFPTSTGNLVSS